MKVRVKEKEIERVSGREKYQNDQARKKEGEKNRLREM